MKRILCPFDFSPSAEILVKYAVHLAKDTSSKIMLLGITNTKTPLAGIFSTGAQGPDESTDQLAEICDELRSIYKIPCDYQDASSDKDYTKVIGERSKEFDVLLLGMRHAADTGELVNSVNIFKILRQSACPVMMVPENFQYHKISRLLYAFDPQKDQHPPVDKLKNMVQWLGARVRFLSIVKKYSPVLENRMDHDFEVFQQEWKGYDVSFDYVYYDNVPKCLDHYVTTWKEDDLITFTISASHAIDGLFHKSVVKEIAECAVYPLLVIHR